jgi:hypothetical protein
MEYLLPPPGEAAASTSTPTNTEGGGVGVVDLRAVHKDPRPAAVIFVDVLGGHTVPPAKHFAMLTRIRLAKAFADHTSRVQVRCPPAPW